MSKIDDIEQLVLSALNSAIFDDYLLVTEDFGVCWNSAQGGWIPDGAEPKACDLFGALVLANPLLDAEEHKGSIHKAVRMLIDPEADMDATESDMESLLESESYRIAQGMQAGWDEGSDIFGHSEAYKLGRRLAEIYKPLPIELLALTHPNRSDFTPVVANETSFDFDSTGQESELILTGLETSTG